VHFIPPVVNAKISNKDEALKRIIFPLLVSVLLNIEALNELIPVPVCDI
jgi:hypothetical protein